MCLTESSQRHVSFMGLGYLFIKYEWVNLVWPMRDLHSKHNFFMSVEFRIRGSGHFLMKDFIGLCYITIYIAI